MSDPFVHLHVASGYSLRHGASSPAMLVDRAADHGMDTLALTDRDGVYGVVKFVTACMTRGIRPILGADLAVQPYVDQPVVTSTRRKTPARGGSFVDARLPRVTVLARDKAGWASVCRLVSATHLGGGGGEPVTTLDLVAAHARGLVVLLGPDSEVGRAVAARRPDLARAHLDRWRHALVDGGAEPHDVVIEVVCHRGPGDAARAARLLTFARDLDLPVVLTNAARGAGRFVPSPRALPLPVALPNAARGAVRGDGPTLDVLDSARRLVALDPRHVDRVNAEAYLKSGKEIRDVVDEIVAAAGLGRRVADDLLAATRRLAERCVLDPRRDLGIGEVHFPELLTGGGADADVVLEARKANSVLRARCEAGLGRRGMAATD